MTSQSCVSAKTTCSNAAAGMTYSGYHPTANSCPTKRCPQAPTGYYLSAPKGSGKCDFSPCDKAENGEYYVSHGGTQNVCPVSDCTNAGYGRFYTGPHRHHSKRCPTAACNPAPVGYYLNETGSCGFAPCTGAVPGQYYSGDGGISNMCPTKSCTNAARGTRYNGFHRNSNNCSTYDCPAADLGWYLSSAGACHKTKCPQLPLGQRFARPKLTPPAATTNVSRRRLASGTSHSCSDNPSNCCLNPAGSFMGSSYPEGNCDEALNNADLGRNFNSRSYVFIHKDQNVSFDLLLLLFFTKLL